MPPSVEINFLTIMIDRQNEKQIVQTRRRVCKNPIRFLFDAAHQEVGERESE
jgi:hypothetical protein